MALSKKLMAGGLAALALLATTATAFAAPAYATGNVNVRSGPGTGYARIDTLRRGEQCWSVGWSPATTPSCSRAALKRSRSPGLT